MADDTDRASELEERHRLAALAKRRPEGLSPTGECLWCGEPVEEGGGGGVLGWSVEIGGNYGRKTTTADGKWALFLLPPNFNRPLINSISPRIT